MCAFLICYAASNTLRIAKEELTPPSRPKGISEWDLDAQCLQITPKKGQLYLAPRLTKAKGSFFRVKIDKFAKIQFVSLFVAKFSNIWTYAPKYPKCSMMRLFLGSSNTVLSSCWNWIAIESKVTLRQNRKKFNVGLTSSAALKCVSNFAYKFNWQRWIYKQKLRLK